MLPANEIFLFVELVRCKSFSNLAKLYDITPAAVSKRISYLEKILGIKLLDRTTRKLAPTEVGEILYNKCLMNFIDLQKTYDSVIDLHKNPRGLLKISSPTNFSNLVLAPIVANFTKQYPDISISITLDDVRNMPPVGDYDIAIRSGVLQDSSAICRHLTTVKFGVFASSEYLKKCGEPLKPADLIDHNCIDYDYRQSGKIWKFINNKEKVEIPISGNLKSNSAFFVKQALLNHAGIACLPTFMVADELKNRKIIQILLGFNTDEMSVSIIYPNSGNYKPKKLSLFIDFLTKAVQKVTC